MSLSSANNLLGPAAPAISSRRRGRRASFTPLSSAQHRSLSTSSSSRPSLPPRRKPLLSLLRELSSKALPIASAVGSSLLLAHLLSAGDGSGLPPRGGGGGDGGGGGGGDFWSRFFRPDPALADDDRRNKQWDKHGLPVDIPVPYEKLIPAKRYKVSEILFQDSQTKRFLSVSRDSFLEMVTLRPGGIYTKEDIRGEYANFENCGMFSSVNLDIRTKADGTLKMTFTFSESKWRAARDFECANVGGMKQDKPPEMDPDMTDGELMTYYNELENMYNRRIARARPCLLPERVSKEIVSELRDKSRVSARMLQWIRDTVQKWYHDEGYACAQVVNFGNLNTDEITCEVVEGDITRLNILFQDKLGNICEGNTDPRVVQREIPKQLFRGHVFNIEAGKQALRNINSLGLFSNIEVNPKPDESYEGGIIVEIKLKELDQKSAEVSTEWSIVPGRNGSPTLASIQPGGTVTIEHRNINGLNRSISASVTSSDLLNPQDDLSYKLEYVHPYVDGIKNPRNHVFRTSCFNSRKLSPVFTGGPGADEVPTIWVDRAGMKANLTESWTRQSKFTYGLVLEEITTRDETSSICTSGSRALPTDGLSIDGPPTTLSGTGTDRMVFLQANITRDNTRFVNGTIIGARNIFQVDQGLGIGSSKPFFNRHQLTLTQFIQLKKVEEGADKPPPPVLVLHGHYGGCVGDLPSYDAFTLGGPYSVRGYNMGEIGAARNILELAAELRIPIRKTHMYGFVEHGNDLSSSEDVKGNPTEFFRRVGQGSSYGVGVKLGLVRAEYAIDHNTGTGALFFRFGERF